VKELIAAEELQTETNEDFTNKLRAETEKHDGLLDELLQVKENLRLTREKFEELTKLQTEQSGESKALTD
jgi:hypothetical protein